MRHLPKPASRPVGPVKAGILALVVANPRAAQLWREMNARVLALEATAPGDLERDQDYCFLCDALTEELLAWVLRSDRFRRSEWR